MRIICAERYWQPFGHVLRIVFMEVGKDLNSVTNHFIRSAENADVSIRGVFGLNSSCHGA